MTTLLVPVTRDYRPDDISTTDVVEFTNAAGTKIAATFNESQFLATNGLEDLTVIGSAGANTFVIYQEFDSFNEILFQNWGSSDRIFAYGGAQVDFMEGLTGSDLLYGGIEDDFLGASGGRDKLYGGAGTDNLQVTDDGNGHELYSGSGNDLLGGGLGDDLLYGGTGNDRLRFVSQLADDGHDQLFGGSGDDTLQSVGNSSGDDLYGGIGTDTVEIHIQVGNSVTIDLTNGGGGADIGTGTRIFDCEILQFFGRDGNHTVTGGSLGDFLYVVEGNSILNGAAGDDIIQLNFEAAGSSAVVNGGAGIDTIQMAPFLGAPGLGPMTLDISDGGGGREVYAGTAGTTLTGFEIANSHGTELGDYMRGGSLGDTLRGNDGNDTIIGGGGADVLRGGDDIDTLSYAFSTVGVSINMATSVASGGDAAGDTFSQFENVTGGAGNDTLVGDGGQNVLSGGNELDSISGGGGADSLGGGSGDDTLDGGSGADTLTGGIGRDTLTGGLGTDSFRFVTIRDSTATASDLITDFTRRSDKIDLSAIDAVPLGGDDAFSFVGTVAFTPGVSGQLRYVQTFSTTVILGDMTGDGVADLRIVLQGLYTLTASDFVL